ncbi:MAG: hypothetical protein RLZZ450_5867 [Pseudomonadota bacterium]|jgi:CheY-like chemotaxis protein
MLTSRVLVVEDDEDSVLLLAETLVGFGYLAEVAQDGATALAKASSFQPHVAVLDIDLPDMDGYQLAAQMRKLSPVTAGMRLVALTGYDGHDELVRAREAGFDAYLVKPVMPTLLAQAIDGEQAAPGASSRRAFTKL